MARHIVQNGRFQAADQAQQWFAEILGGGEALLGVFDPLRAADAHIVHPHGRQQAAQRQRFAEQQQARHIRPPAPVDKLDQVECVQHLLVADQQLLGLGAHAGAQLPVESNGAGVEVIPFGIRQYHLLEAHP